MKTIKLVVVGLVVLALVLVTGALLARNAIIKTAAETMLKEQTGFDLDVKKINVGVLRPVFDIQSLKLKNPDDFPDQRAIDVERIRVHYKPLSLLSDTLKFKNVEVRINEVVMVTKADGESNMKRLERQAKKASKPKPKSPPTGERPKTPEPPPGDAPAPGKKASKSIRIDKLTLEIGRVEMLDYRKPRRKRRDDQGNVIEPEIPRKRTVEIDYEKTFTDVTDEQFTALGFQVAAEIALTSLAGLDFEHIAENLEQVGHDVEKTFKDLTEGREDELEKLGKGLESIGKDLEKSFGKFFKKAE